MAVLLLGVGCRDRSTPQTRQDKLCKEAAEVDGLVAQLATDTGNAGEIRSRIEAQWREVEEAAEDVTAFNIDTLRAAYQKVLAARDEVAIDQAAGEFSDARLNLHTTAAC